MFWLSDFIFNLGNIKNKYKVLVLSLIDLTLIITSIGLAFFFIYDFRDLNQILVKYKTTNFLYLITTICIYWFSGFYYIITRYAISTFLYNLFLRNLFSLLSIYLASRIFNIPFPQNKISHP